MGLRVHQVIPTILLWIILVQVICCQAQNRNIKLVAMNGNQYWFSSTSPYSPQLNFHLAYQYCRTLGLQLAVLETKEEVDQIAQYLKTTEVTNEYWTSGNKLGSEDSWIWMSSGEQLNTTFSEYWLQQKQQTGGSKHCMTMQVSSLSKRTLFSPEECGRPLSFICEQLRCLYYNYPVTPFPDPGAEAEIAALRADLDATSSTASASESRSLPHLFEEDALRIQNYLLNTGKDKYTEQNLPYALRRRISLRPPTTSLKDTEITHPHSPVATDSSDYSHRTLNSEQNQKEGGDSGSLITTTTATTSTTISPSMLPSTTVKFGLIKASTTPKDHLWTQSPVATDLNYVTVKNVLVSKSEKVSYSSNYSNIHGVPLPSSAHGPKAYYINRQQQRPSGSYNANHNNNDFLSGIQVDSHHTHQEQHEATETIFYDDIQQGHTENYHFDESTEVISSQEQETDGGNKENQELQQQQQLQQQNPVKMFQFQRSKSPVSWLFNPKPKP